jgi:hypothetical protein
MKNTYKSFKFSRSKLLVPNIQFSNKEKNIKKTESNLKDLSFSFRQKMNIIKSYKNKDFKYKSQNSNKIEDKINYSNYGKISTNESQLNTNRESVSLGDKIQSRIKEIQKKLNSYQLSSLTYKDPINKSNFQDNEIDKIEAN